jgi:segregation and condensation protein A
VLLPTYPIHIPAFEGPLDLLLQLIERDELDVTAISLVQVTDQYLAVIEEMGRRGIADLTAFLVVAAKLVLIKSQALLPRPPSEGTGGEEDAAADLLQQLETYRRFKRIAQELAHREQQGRHAYVRTSTPPPPKPTFDLEDTTLQALFVAAQEALDSAPAETLEELPPPVLFTVADQVQHIRERVTTRGRIRFRDVLSRAAGRVEVIVTLLAVLQMVKDGQLRMWQEELFGPIFMAAPESPPDVADEISSQDAGRNGSTQVSSKD